jgi:DNA-binding transcriptional MerR regulator
MASRTPSRPKEHAKIFYKIGEVCEATQTEPYVLRYWESEFPFLAPEKNRAGQRIYSGDDIQLVLAIKRLLYEEGYTTAGARRRLEKEIQDRRGGASPDPAAAAAPSPAPAAPGAPADAGRAAELEAALRHVRGELSALRATLSGEGRTAPDPLATSPRAAGRGPGSRTRGRHA